VCIGALKEVGFEPSPELFSADGKRTETVARSSRFSVQQCENYICEVLTFWLAHISHRDAPNEDLLYR